ncbi:MAG: hypothetical protein U9R34_01805 [Nanoarchaeota archaeon]|nr:hypothetical protein [Nanoarchaeota archaeon]
MGLDTQYYTPMDREYMIGPDIKSDANIEKPLLPLSSVGQTVTEGARFGTLINTVQGAIKMGAGSIELQTGMGGGVEAVGAEAYGKDARETLREMARANEVTLTSVHAPVQIGNLSGLGQQGFRDEERRSSVDEVKKAIKFAAETTGGGAIVVHTGEYQRPIFDASWNQEGKWKGAFVGYDEEPDKATVMLVDKKTGRLFSEVKRNQIIHTPDWNTSEKNYSYTADELDEKRGVAKAGEIVHISKNGYIDYEGKKLKFADRVARWDSKKGEFEIKPRTWKDFVAEAKEMNDSLGRKSGDENYITPEEAVFKAQTQSQIAIAKGYKLNYGGNVDELMKSLKDLKKQFDFYKKIEEGVSDDEQWKLKRQAQSYIARFVDPGLAPPPEYKLPSEIIKEGLNHIRQNIDSSREMVMGQEQSIREQTERLKNIVSVGKYAKAQSMKSYAEAGIFAMKESQNNPYANRDIFVAPENIWPEMGYGSHPEELKHLVLDARKTMANRLTNPVIDNPTGKIITQEEAKDINKKFARFGVHIEEGDIELIENPDYTGMSKEKAAELAKRHIKATWDTQHMGMWWKHFKPETGETEQARRERFNEWYMDEVKELKKYDIIGNIHLVDAIGGGHHHLPMGQGDLPLMDALTYLKKKGYTGSINSEAHGEMQMGADRILVETWKALGSPIYSFGAPGASLAAPNTWGDIHRSYFGQNNPPYFIFGDYAPSQDFTLWSQVPME